MTTADFVGSALIVITMLIIIEDIIQSLLVLGLHQEAANGREAPSFDRLGLHDEGRHDVGDDPQRPLPVRDGSGDCVSRPHDRRELERPVAVAADVAPPFAGAAAPIPDQVEHAEVRLEPLPLDVERHAARLARERHVLQVSVNTTQTEMRCFEVEVKPLKNKVRL